MAKKKMSAEVKDRIRRMKWWHDAKFGMFIHWGLYAELGRHEWAMYMEGIPSLEYERLAKKFKPKKNAARDWARLARKAGMKYMVMTTKHHEGFCLFDTKTTDYCAPKQACGRDLVQEYVNAARAEGLGVGFYFSLMDWHHPDGESCAWDEDARKRFVKYMHAQVRELCTNYGKIDIMWYDVSHPLDAKGWESRKLNKMVFALQPDIVINDRSQLPMDFGTPEQHISAQDDKGDGRGWEACMTMNGSWGYHKNDHDWKTPSDSIRNLITCARGGGNYLFNIGPKPDGSIPPDSIRILTKVGEWLKGKNSKTIFGADRCSVGGSLFSTFTQKGKTLWVHCQHWPGSDWSLAGIKTKVKSAKLLCTGKKVEFKQDAFRLHFTGLPASAPDDPITVIELEMASANIKQERSFKDIIRADVNVSF